MRHRIPLAVSLAALFFSMTGAGMAATGYRITSIWQLSPKVRHALRGHQGPQGQPGIQGTPGATGPQGPPAIQHLDGDYTATSGADLTTETPAADVIVRCQPGDHVLTGGYQGHDEITTTDQLVASNGVSGRGWEVIAHLDPAAQTGRIQTTVLCVTN